MSARKKSREVLNKRLKEWDDKNMLNEEVFKKALDQWGTEAQIGMCIEEAGEMLTAINHYKRKRIGIGELVEEFVDVYIMMNQMRWMNQDLFDQILKLKVTRLRSKLGLPV